MCQSYPTQLEAPDHPEGKIQLLMVQLLMPILKSKKDSETGRTPNGRIKEKTKVEKVAHTNKKSENRAHMKRIESATKIFMRTPFFLENSERILSDSRMFLAPVPLRSNLAYFGHAPFESPTLGIYIEFCKNSEYSVFNYKYNIQRVVGSMAGSTLSGNNFTVCGDKFGRIKEMHITKFSSTARDFMFINKRYKEVKEKYDAYTLSEVIEISVPKTEYRKFCRNLLFPKCHWGKR